MAKVLWKYPIDELHGKLKDDFGAAQRKSKNWKGEREPFSVIYGKRSTEYTAEELAHQTRFGAICVMANARRKDVSKATSDMTAFKAQSQWKTFKQYLWHVCEALYDGVSPNPEGGNQGGDEDPDGGGALS